MRKNRSPDDIREALFAQPGFWNGCAECDLALAEQTENEIERDWLENRANRHLDLAENPNARNQADLRDW